MKVVGNKNFSQWLVSGIFFTVPERCLTQGGIRGEGALNLPKASRASVREGGPGQAERSKALVALQLGAAAPTLGGSSVAGFSTEPRSAE